MLLMRLMINFHAQNRCIELLFESFAAAGEIDSYLEIPMWADDNRW
jgi:hypothetical protein